MRMTIDEEKIKLPGKQPVLPSTIEILDLLYAPFNKRLSELLGDEKWLFKRR